MSNTANYVKKIVSGLLYHGWYRHFPASYGTIPILHYHRVNDHTSNSIRVEVFRQQMCWLFEQGWHTISVRDACYFLLSNQPLPDKVVAITFDDGYEDNYLYAFPILKQYKFIATIFLVTDYVNTSKVFWWCDGVKRYNRILDWDQICEMKEYGIEFGAHTCSHRVLAKLSTKEIEHEIKTSQWEIEKHIDESVNLFAYPFGIVNDTVIGALKNGGYLGACTSSFGHNRQGQDVFQLRRIAASVTNQSNLDLQRKISGSFNLLYQLHNELRRPQRTFHMYGPPIKVLYVNATNSISGTEGQLLELVTHIDRDTFYPELCILDEEGQVSKAAAQKHIPIVTLDRKGHYDLSRLVRLLKILRRGRYQIVHSFGYSANSYARLAGKLANVPVIISSERGAYRDRKKHIKTIDGLLSRLSRHIIVNAKSIVDFLVREEGIETEKISVIHNGIDLSRFDADVNATALREQLKIPGDHLVVGTVGRLARQKNHGLFLKVAAQISQKEDRVIFLIVGDGPLRCDLLQLARDLGINDQRMRFLGHRTDAVEVMRIFDVFVLTSLWEGMPNVVLEAMAARRPVVSTAVDGSLDIITNGTNGFLVKTDDMEAMRDAILKLLHDEELRRRIGEEGRKTVEARFTVDKMAEATENVYRTLLRKRVGHST